MLNIISVGINHAIPDLTCPCASTDAMKIYEAFAETCSKTFSTYNSLSLADIKSNEFIDIIEVTKHTVIKMIFLLSILADMVL